MITSVDVERNLTKSRKIFIHDKQKNPKNPTTATKKKERKQLGANQEQREISSP